MNHSTRDDQKKLARTIKYLIVTRHLPLILYMNKYGVSEWWVDASFAVHDDMRSRNEAIFSMGSGVSYCVSTKQNIVTTSSTKIELARVVDFMPKILWRRHFVEAQSCIVKVVYAYQDN